MKNLQTGEDTPPARPYTRAMTPAPVKPLVTPDDLEKLDIRVGTIEGVSDVSGSRKLVKLHVEFGDHKRQILAGLKGERPDPAALVGQQAFSW
jgi:tRNA-binding protein